MKNSQSKNVHPFGKDIKKLLKPQKHQVLIRDVQMNVGSRVIIQLPTYFSLKKDIDLLEHVNGAKSLYFSG